MPLEEANATAARFLKITGIKRDDVKTLRSLMPEQLLDWEIKMRTGNAGPGEVAKTAAAAPVIDGEIIPDITNKLAKKGAAKGIPSIIGTNLEEWRLFAFMEPGFAQLDEAEMLKRLSVFMPEESARGLAAVYRQAREKRGETATPAEILSAIQTDLMFRMPALGARSSAAGQQDAGLITISLPGNRRPWAALSAPATLLEIGFVFGKRNARFCGTGPAADKLSECMQEAWLAFARTGDPSCQCSGKWPVYGKDRMTMIFDKESRVEVAPYEAERQAWDKYGLLSTRLVI